MKANPTLIEKASSGWWNGCNSAKFAWLMPDTQYRWAVNMVNRGGILQTRPGYRMRITLPAGNLQGLKSFRATKIDSFVDDVLVAAVDGKVYYIPFVNGALTQPSDWESLRLKNIQFNPLATQVYWCVAEKSATSASTGTISFVATYSVLMMQDGSSAAAYWDGKTDGHLDESPVGVQTPTGRWMSYTGSRLWVARENAVLASDLADPLSFRERTVGTGGGDFRFTGSITGLANTSDDTRKSNLAVFTEENTSTLQSSILNRDLWGTTQGFQSLLYENLGCVSGRSITSHAGLLWWYSHGGLVASDSATANFLTSSIKYKDVEMAFSKRNLANDISMVCAGSFENYLLVSVPSGDTLNAHTMVLDYAISSELLEEASPAWNGVWVGTRPVEWAVSTVDGTKRMFHASVDYQSITSGGSFNHIWEAFQPERLDSYETALGLVSNPIYWSFESKLLGDGMDYKRFKFAEVDLTEIGGDVTVKVSYGGSKGGYNEVLRKRIVATLTAEGHSDDDLARLAARKVFKTQSRRIRTREANVDIEEGQTVESTYPESIDKYFGLFIEGCGRCGIEAFRIYTEPLAEVSTGACEEDETGIKVVTEDGESFEFSE